MELADQNIRLAKHNALLEGVGRAALESGGRHLAQLARISAMARAIGRRGVSETDRASLLAALGQACEQVEQEARAHMDALRFAMRSRREFVPEDAWEDSTVECLVAHRRTARSASH